MENGNFFAEQLKKSLFMILDRIAENPALAAKNPGVDFTRKRKIDIKTLLLLLISMGGNTLNKEIYDYFSRNHLPIPTKSALVQQRNKLNPEILYQIFMEFNQHLVCEKKYKGFRLYATDGTDLQIATDPSEPSYLEKTGTTPYNMLHINAIYDLLNKTYVDCLIEPKTAYNEVRACIAMAERTIDSVPTIIIGDRLFKSRNLQEHLNRMHNMFYVFRVPNGGTTETSSLPMTTLDVIKTIEIRTGQTNADKEAYASGKAVYVSGPSKQGKVKKQVNWDFESPFLFSTRIVRFPIGDKGEYETLVTSLPSNLFSLDDLKELYRLRWGIETSFRELKYVIGMLHTHSKKEEFVIQEIYAHFIMYNYCECITMHVVIYQSEGCKHIYQANFTMAIHICIDYFRYSGSSPPDVDNLISRHILPVRPGRKDKRKLVAKGMICFTYRVA